MSAQPSSPSLPRVSHFVAGKPFAGSPIGTSPVYNPAHGHVAAEVDLASVADIDAAVRAAHAAFPAWSQTPALRRARVMFRFKELIERDMDRLARIIVAEHGKVLSDAKGELVRGLEVVEYACGIPELLKGEYTEQISNGIDAWTMRQALGVCAGITRSTSPPWCPCGCSPWPSPAATASC